ncbi:hypothetical protein FHR22_001687 [Sphingopyxis panaciterrae]|uniref:hypothetical protein n=1 Tax=Sphingopyxis panaciterrae TaxID=363841 RepID=UPI00141E2515|nr:hypothetical protein [Sphingopyxis panaciterrae]NIJ37003.1 hypothetical protein [Sphingopyxis panaciterrae]
MKALAAFRIALALSLLGYFAVLAAGVGGLIAAEGAMAIGSYAVLAVAVAALGCVVTQSVLFISHKRHVAHG